MAVGYLYILSNSAVAGLLKIGFTCGNVEIRARELSSPTGIAAPFEIEYFHLSEDVEAVEQIVHSALEPFRHSERREFFRLSIAEAIAAIERAVRKPQVRFARPRINGPLSPSSIFVCKRCGYDYFKSPQRRFCPKCGF